jgi:NAD(P)H-flavin reductase
MMFSRVLSVFKEGPVNRIEVEFPSEPKPGQFVSVIIKGPKEIPLSVGDWEDNKLTLFVESEALAKSFGRYVMVKGPLGRPLDLRGKRLIAIAYRNQVFDLNYVLKSAQRRGMEVYVKCYECKTPYPEPKELDADLIIASVPREMVKSLPRNSLVYVRWAKMNCMVGVCGKCEVNGKLACSDGPFLRWEDVVQG